jgi:autotransporter passenger strand-loop-strand repeat protein
LEIGSGNTASGLTLVSGQILAALSGGTVSGTVVSSGGSEIVAAGGTASGTIVSGGSISVAAQGTAINTSVGLFGVDSVAGQDISATLRAGATQYIFSGGIAIATTVSAGALEDILSGGSALSTTISGGGVAFVFSGGAATSTFLANDGTLYVLAGGSASGTVLDGNAKEFVSGIDTSAIVSSGDSQIVESGGIAIATTILSGGTQLVSAGGTASDTVISGGTLDISAGGIVSGAVSFSGTGGTYEIDGTAIPGATVSGFISGDSFDLRGIAFDSGAGHVDLTSGNVLVVTENGSAYDINLASGQDFAGDYFHLAADGFGGTLVTEDTTPCYCPGTLILTPAGEVPVEDLKIGDRVVTLFGRARPIEWIGRRSYSGDFVLGRDDILPVCIKAGALESGIPRHDLWVSPNHALYLGGVLIEAKDLVNGVSVYQADTVETVEYIHFELDAHDVVLAEGAWAESYIDDDNRGLFHNAHEYRVLYPERMSGPAQYCAPRHEEGFAVERARRWIAERAALPAPVEMVPSGALRGHVDQIGRRCIIGWAQDETCPEAPVCLDIYAGSELVGQVVANRFRPDLAAAGIGDGRHGFEFVPPEELALTPGAVRVCRTRGGALDVLEGSSAKPAAPRKRRAG